MSTHNLSQVGNNSAINIISDSEDNANTVMERDGSGNSKAKNLTATTTLIAGAGTNFKVVNKTTTFTADPTEATVYTVDSSGGAVTVNLPAAASSTNVTFIILLKTVGNNVVLDGNSSETVNGATTKTSSTQYNSAILFCNGTAWLAILTGTWA